MRGLLLDLFPKTPDMHHQSIFIGIIAVAPDRVAERVKGDDFSPVFIELSENQKLLGGQGNLAVRSAYRAPVKVRNRSFWLRNQKDKSCG